MGGLCLEQDPPGVPGNRPAVLEVAGGHESKELAALEGKSEALSYFPGDVGDDGLGASFKKDLVFDEGCHQVPGATLTAKCITVLLPRSVFNKDGKRSLQVDDLPVQDVMPHDQHRGSLRQNKKETPEVQGQVTKFRCFQRCSQEVMLAPPLPLPLLRSHNGQPTLISFLFFPAPGKRISTFRTMTFPDSPKLNYPATAEGRGRGENKWGLARP